MDKKRLNHLLHQVASGELSVAAAETQLIGEDDGLSYARLDTQRELRRGFPEVVYGAGKTAVQVAEILLHLSRHHAGNLLATRCDEAKYEAVRQVLPEACFDQTSGLIYLRRDTAETGLVGVLAAGTSDLAVAEEAALTAWLLGAHVERCYDVGVSGLHRLLAHGQLLAEAKTLIVVAGMEGALASVVGGLTPAPVVAVPTSVGYGASFHGLAALLAMLNSCCAGVSVVNIDNGFGAGYLAAVINRQSVA